MKKLAITFVCITFVLQTLFCQNLTGNWEVSGSYPSGSDYAGGINIQFVGKSIYSLEWTINSTKDPKPLIFPGTGTYLKEAGQFIVAYGIDTKRYGLFSYDLNDKKGLLGTGVWTSHEGKGAELIGGKLNKSVLEGTYEVVGRRPQGDVDLGISETYQGILKIIKVGKRYDLTWTLGDDLPYNGFGYISGDKLVGVWGVGDGYGLVTYTFDPTLSTGTATWTSPKYSFKEGNETILRK